MKIKICGVGIEHLKSQAISAGIEISRLAAQIHVSQSTLLKAMDGEPIRPSSYVRIRDYFFDKPELLNMYATIV